MCLPICQFFIFYIFHLIKLKIGTGGDDSVLIPNSKSKMLLKWDLILRIMHQSIPSTNIPRAFPPIFSPGPGDLYHLNCPGVAEGSDLLSKYQVVS